MKSQLHIIHSNSSSNDHLKGMTEEEIKIIRTLANIFVDNVLRKVDEDSISVYKEIKRGSK